MEESLFVTLVEISDYAGVSQSTVKRWVHEAGFPAFQIGGRGQYRAYQEDIDAWMEKQRDKQLDHIDEF